MNKIIPNSPLLPPLVSLNQVHEHFDHADPMQLHQLLPLHPRHPLKILHPMLSIVNLPLPPIICNYVPIMYVTQTPLHIKSLSFSHRLRLPARSSSILCSMNYHQSFSLIIPMNFINMTVRINALFMRRKIFINYHE